MDPVALLDAIRESTQELFDHCGHARDYEDRAQWFAAGREQAGELVDRIKDMREWMERGGFTPLGTLDALRLAWTVAALYL